jgi:hypothetical protein
MMTSILRASDGFKSILLSLLRLWRIHAANNIFNVLTRTQREESQDDKVEKTATVYSVHQDHFVRP